MEHKGNHGDMGTSMQIQKEVNKLHVFGLCLCL